eukprot:UN11529
MLLLGFGFFVLIDRHYSYYFLVCVFFFVFVEPHKIDSIFLSMLYYLGVFPAIVLLH